MVMWSRARTGSARRTLVDTYSWNRRDVFACFSAQKELEITKLVACYQTGTVELPPGSNAAYIIQTASPRP